MTLLVAGLSAAEITITGKVYAPPKDGKSVAIDGVMVTVVFSDNTSKSDKTKDGGKYTIGPLTPPGRIQRIDYGKAGVGYKELEDLSELDPLNISIYLGVKPTTLAKANLRLAEMESLVLRAKADPKTLTLPSKVYLGLLSAYEPTSEKIAPMVTKEFKTLRDLKGLPESDKNTWKIKVDSVEKLWKELKPQ